MRLTFLLLIFGCGDNSSLIADAPAADPCAFVACAARFADAGPVAVVSCEAFEITDAGTIGRYLGRCY